MVVIFKPVMAPATNITQVSGTSQTARDWSVDFRDMLKTKTTIASQQLSIGTSAVNFSSQTSHTCTVKADNDNTAPIYVGDSTVTTTTGYRLEPAEAVTIYIDNANKIYCISTATGQKAHLIVET